MAISINKVVKVVPNVNQTLGFDPAVFAKIGLPGREVPVCKEELQLASTTTHEDSRPR